MNEQFDEVITYFLTKIITALAIKTPYQARQFP